MMLEQLKSICAHLNNIFSSKKWLSTWKHAIPKKKSNHLFIAFSQFFSNHQNVETWLSIFAAPWLLGRQKQPNASKSRKLVRNGNCCPVCLLMTRQLSRMNCDAWSDLFHQIVALVSTPKMFSGFDFCSFKLPPVIQFETWHDRNMTWNMTKTWKRQLHQVLFPKCLAMEHGVAGSKNGLLLDGRYLGFIFGLFVIVWRSLGCFCMPNECKNVEK